MADFTMQEPLRSDVISRLKADMDGEPHGPYIQRIKCPDCGKREAFSNLEAPWIIQCGRLSKCGTRAHIKDLFPDLFSTWTERYRPAPSARSHDYPATDPTSNAVPVSRTPVADAYLSIGRGFDLTKITGWYTEETYHDAAIEATTTTVRFALPGGYWERLIDRPERFGKKKARVQPGTNYAGDWWAPPGLSLVEQEEIWIVEGIFDAIALSHAGIPACASVGVSNYPGAALAALATAIQAAGRSTRPTLVWAYDGDAAGSKYSRAHAKQAAADGWDCTAARIVFRDGRKRDWNDAWQRGELEPAHIEEYRYHGALHLAPNAAAKGTLIYLHDERKEFWYEFGRRVFWFKLDVTLYEKHLKALGYENIEGESIADDEREEAIKAARSIQELSNCYPRALYYLANPITDEAWYYYAVEHPHDGQTNKFTFTSSQLASASEFKKRLLHGAPGAMWEGTSSQLDRLLRTQLARIKTVETIDFIGYTREHGAYLWGDIAVRNGKLYAINAEDYFDFERLSLKTLAQSPVLHINDNRQDYQTAWAAVLWQAYGAKGVIALAFWLGAVFAEQIRKDHKSFPFLEIVGEASSGKSTLIEFLWKLCGRRDYEGFDPLKSTQAGRSRNMTQVANLPVVLIESDRETDNGAKQRQFDWDEFKPLYNGRPTRSRGFRNQGNDTYEPPFRGALVISQNATVAASDAILQRIVHLEFTRETHTAETKRLAEILERTPIEQVSGWILTAAMREKDLLKLFDEVVTSHETYLSNLPGIRILRLAKNYAQLAALVECLGSAGLGILPDNAIGQTTDEIARLAVQRQTDLNADHPIVQEFWEAYEYLDGLGKEAAKVNHAAAGSGLIAINLKHIEAVAAFEHVRIPDATTLKRHLKTSKGRKFIESNRPHHSRLFVDGRTVRCWIFADQPKQHPVD